MMSETVRTRLIASITERFALIYATAEQRWLSLRNAVMLLDVEAVCQAVAARGTPP